MYNYEINNGGMYYGTVQYGHIGCNFQPHPTAFDRYSFFWSKENALLAEIYNTGYLCIYKDKLYYRENYFSPMEKCIWDKKELSRHLSKKYNINVYFVDDLNKALEKQKVNAVFLSLNKIPKVIREVFMPDLQYGIVDVNGYIYFNLFRPTVYLSNKNFNIDQNVSIQFVEGFLSSFLKNGKSSFVTGWIANFYNSLIASTDILLLIGNQYISENILWKKIIQPIFGKEYCITITDKILSKMSVEEITKNKLFYHINHIPASVKNREKLKELLTFIITKNSRSSHDCIGQVIITLDDVDLFLKDIGSVCKAFFIKPTQDIFTALNVSDEMSLSCKIVGSLNDLTYKFMQIKQDNISDFAYSRTDNQKLTEKLETLNSVDSILEKDMETTDIKSFLPTKDRYKHTYITGQSGSGKSELLKTLIYQDILRNDGSVVCIDPHGDLAENVVKLVKDKERLLYINPFLKDGKAPTINLFDIKDKSDSNIEQMTQVILNAIQSVNSEESLSGAMEDVLENCISILLRKGNGSFEELFRFMSDKTNEDLVRLGKNSPNSLQADFFKHDFSNSNLTKDALRRRLKRLLNDRYFSSLVNGRNTIDLAKEINTKGKVIVFNIPKGKMLNTYMYYIKYIVEYIQIIALKRADVDEKNRVHTHLYIDEAHNFISSSSAIVEILAESRKYKLFVTFAH